MRLMIGGILAAAALAGTATVGAADEKPAAVHIDKIAVGTAIDNRELSGAADTFDAGVPRIYCWTRVSSDQAPITLKHVWYADGKPVAEVPLTLSASGRTWSSKSVWEGSWKVEAVDAGRAVLNSVSFTVGKKSTPATSPATTTPAQ